MTVQRGSAEILTFLIADIRGYTSFTQSRGDEAAAALAGKFAEIAREGIEAHGGRLLELRGDEALAVFSSARASLRSAADLQAVFADETALTSDLPLTVGIGIDAGEAIPVEDGYRGGALNLAARLCSLAKAGEILASEGLIHLARAVDGLKVSEWGTAELKGLPQPVTVYQVQRDGAEPERMTFAATDGRLPPALDVITPMIGRDAEQRQLSWAWRMARRGNGSVAVVRGVSGIGKTRLLAAIAQTAVANGGGCRYRSLAEGPWQLEAPDAGLAYLDVVDDLDAAGPHDIDRLVELAREVREYPVLLAVAIDDLNASDEALRAVHRLNPAVELSLAPLDLQQMQQVVALYLDSSAWQVPTDLLTATGGVPRQVHAAVSEWLDTATSRRLGALASRAASGRDDLRSLESDLAGSVVDLQQVRERARMFGLGPGRHAEEPSAPPYKGLSNFDTDDADSYFGRERVLAEVLARLAGATLLGVIGASGSGKSSLVRAGLVPALQDGVLPGSERWTTVVVRPGEHPNRALDVAVLPALPKEVAGRLSGKPGLLSEIATILTPDQRVVIVLDQFEELFTVCTDEADRTEFINGIADAVTLPDSGVSVVLTVRADFYGRCAAEPRLASLLADNHLLVGAMTADEYRRAIVSPALRVGAVVEPELVEALVNDVLGEPGALPLLSTTLLELWDARSGRTLTAASYEQLGGVHGAVARMADTAYEALSEAQQEAARRSLLRLAGPGDGDSVVRRRVPVSDFDGDQEAAEVLRTLTDRRLLTVSDGYVEVAHEALLREWPRFRGWLEEDREGLRLRAHLATAAAAWIASGRDTGELYRGARLAAALDWTTQHSLDLNNVEREFVTNSRDESQQALRRQQRQNRRLRGLLSGVAVLLVVALIAGVVAIVQRRHARHDATVALARSVGATAVSTPRIDEAMLLARQAVLFNRSPQTDSTLLSTVLRAPTLEHTFTVPNTVRPQRVYLSSDDRMLAELGNDGTWRFFNAATGRSILRPLPNIVDGNWVGRDFFTASVDRSGKFPTIVWSLYTVGHTLTKVATMQSSHALNALPTGQPLTFGSPDGKYFYTAYPVVAPDTGDNVGGYVDRWSVSSHRRQELKLPAAGVNAFAFTGGNRLAILTDSSEVSIDTARWRITRNRHVAGLPSQTLAALSPDGTRAAYVPVNTPDSFVVKDLSSGAIRRPAGGHSADIESLGFSPNGRLLITAGDDGTAREWDATSLSSVEILNGDSGRVLSEAFSNDSQTLFTCSLDGSIFEWALGDGNRFGRPIALAHPITAPEPLSARPALAFSPDGKQVVASILTGGAEVARVSLSNGLTRVATIGSLSRRVTAVAWSAGGTIATGSDHGVQLWQAPYLSPELSLTTSPGIAAALAFSHDGRNLIVGTGGQATLSDNPTEAGWIDGYTTASGQPLFPPVNLKHPVIALALSPDDRLIAASLDDGTVRILKADDGQPVAQFRVAGFTTGPAISLAFASNGDLLIGSFVGLVQRVNPKTGAELGPPVLSEPAPVSSISISPDGAKFVTTGGSSGGMRLWDSRTFQQVGSDFPGGESHWANAVFSPDGTTAIDLYDDGTGTIWPVTDSALMAHACAVARRNLTQEEWRRFVQGASYRRTCPQFG